LPVTPAGLYILSLHIWRTNHVLKILGAARLLTSGLAITAAPQAFALQAVVTQVDKSADGTTTYHFAVKTDPGETRRASRRRPPIS
jgi:hypothetical protein